MPEYRGESRDEFYRIHGDEDVRGDMEVAYCGCGEFLPLDAPFFRGKGYICHDCFAKAVAEEAAEDARYAEIEAIFLICEANARLMSAAPELLEALKAVVAVADRDTDVFNAARQAIAKAECEEPHA